MFAARTPHERKRGSLRVVVRMPCWSSAFGFRLILFRHRLRRQRLVFDQVLHAPRLEASDHAARNSLQARRGSTFLLRDVAPASRTAAPAWRAYSSSALTLRGPVLWQRAPSSSPPGIRQRPQQQLVRGAVLGAAPCVHASAAQLHELSQRRQLDGRCRRSSEAMLSWFRSC